MDWNELSKLVENMWDEHLREEDPMLKGQIKNVVKEHAPRNRCGVIEPRSCAVANSWNKQ